MPHIIRHLCARVLCSFPRCFVALASCESLKPKSYTASNRPIHADRAHRAIYADAAKRNRRSTTPETINRRHQQPNATMKGSNVNNLVLNVLPDNRPITSLQIVEDYEKCPKEFVPIHRTHDQDSDADLWRENGILFGRRTNRYLCQSKSQGLPNYVVETLTVIADKEQPPAGYSLLQRTADTEQRAWRKRQIAYKLSRRGTIQTAVTDIILCSKLRQAPSGFELAGEINGITVCYKLGACAHRSPPTVPKVPDTNGPSSLPVQNGTAQNIEDALHYMNISPKAVCPLPDPPAVADYENVEAPVSLPALPQRSAPGRPTSSLLSAPVTPLGVVAAERSGIVVTHRTLGPYSDLDGVSFRLSEQAIRQLAHGQADEAIARLADAQRFEPQTHASDYAFQLERQVLCSLKTSTSKNPFFQK